ncbi:transposable element Tcb2 transposase [Trichonephila clavipes]|nr:transposable element Tcb2 transposase [Trichonephila clavipes]
MRPKWIKNGVTHIGQLSAGKVLLSTYFNIQVLLLEFKEPDVSIHAQRYTQALDKLNKAILKANVQACCRQDLKHHENYVQYKLIKNAHNNIVDKIHCIPHRNVLLSSSKLDTEKSLVLRDLSSANGFQVYSHPQAAIQAQAAPSLGAPVPSRTMRRRVAEGHLGSWRPLLVLPLTPTHRRLRLEWCRARGNWTAAEWNQVVFSDESRFNLSSDDNRVRVWRPRVERLNPAFALQRHTSPTAGVMVWGAIAYNTGVSPSIDPWHHDSPVGVTCFDFNTTHNIVATGSKDFLVRVWEIQCSSKPDKVLGGHRAVIADVRIHEKRNFVLSLCKEREVRMFDLKTGSCLHTVGIRVPLSLPHLQYGNSALHISCHDSDHVLVTISDVTTRMCLDGLEEKFL